MTERIGFIGVGLMGHGMARNILEKGHPLTVLGHRNRAPVEDLVKRGAAEAKSAAEIARRSDIVFLCVTGSTEVESLVRGPNGLAAGAHQGLVIVDCSTSGPSLESSRCRSWCWSANRTRRRRRRCRANWRQACRMRV